MASAKPLSLLDDLRVLIEQTRTRVAQTVNSELVLLYWQIGARIRADVLQNERAEYGKEIVPTLAAKLTAEFGKGFDRANLFNMLRFAEVYPEREIIYALSRQLTWTHFRRLIYLDDALKRDFYAEMCRLERWSSRTLNDKINGMLFERTAIAKKPDEIIKKELADLRETDKITPDLIFRDPYILDFLRLPADYSEQDLETAILREIERFLLELGTDFSFVARQKRMTIGKEDYYLDLLFYHRALRRLVAIELTLGKFTPEYFGKMTLYLRWLDKYERRAGEDAPLGLVLCGEKDSEQIELLELDKQEMRVAEYLTELPPRDLLQARLQKATRLAQAQFLGEKVEEKE